MSYRNLASFFDLAEVNGTVLSLLNTAEYAQRLAPVHLLHGNSQQKGDSMFKERLNTVSEIISGEAKHKAVHEGLCYSSVK